MRKGLITLLIGIGVVVSAVGVTKVVKETYKKYDIIRQLEQMQEERGEDWKDEEALQLIDLKQHYSRTSDVYAAISAVPGGIAMGVYRISRKKIKEKEQQNN